MQSRYPPVALRPHLPRTFARPEVPPQPPGLNRDNIVIIRRDFLPENLYIEHQKAILPGYFNNFQKSFLF
jgi:hypothetical protein